jgi:Ca2+-binding RTX toxin-like protein
MRRTLLFLSTMMLALLLASGVAWAVNMVGTNGPDTLRGTNGDDNLIGNGGNDRLFARNGRDNLLGGPGKDCLLCITKNFHVFGGDKNLFGGPGNDFVWDGKGADNVEGGEGNDLLPDDLGRELSQDNFSGGAGSDVIDVPQYRSAGGDRVVCGSGFDWVAADKKDVVAPDCEKVVVFMGGTHSDFNHFYRAFYPPGKSVVPKKWFDGLQKRCLPDTSNIQALVRAKKG